jgi:hypothetical protein
MKASTNPYHLQLNFQCGWQLEEWTNADDIPGYWLLILLNLQTECNQNSDLEVGDWMFYKTLNLYLLAKTKLLTIFEGQGLC